MQQLRAQPLPWVPSTDQRQACPCCMLAPNWHGPSGPPQATAGWMQRCERMAASHKPLTAEEQARHERRMHRYYANTASQVMTLSPEQH